VWTQGLPTPAEWELGLKCFDYADSPGLFSLDDHVSVAANVGKVPLLAARWGLDPADLGEIRLAQAQGIAGERY
jgi:hypothetical protein